MKQTTPLFNESLRNLVQPALQRRGFAFDGRRRFSRTEHGQTAIIEFQIGQRFMDGRFTINLMCDEKFQRLGLVRDTPWSRLIERLFGGFNPWWKALFLPKDKWWRLGTSATSTDKQVLAALHCLETYGLRWLEQQCER